MALASPEEAVERLHRFCDVIAEREMSITERMRELADLLGVNLTTVYRWRNGSSPVSPIAANALHNAIGKMEKKYDLA